MLTASDVVSSIEALLGRTPDPDLVDYHLALGFTDRSALDDYLRCTDEYRYRQEGAAFPGATLNDSWADRARGAEERRERLRSFGQHAFALLVKGSEDRYFAVDPEDAAVTAKLLQNGEYNSHEARELARLMPRDAVVLVVGAHIGTHVVPLSRNCERLIAVEANPKTFELLNINLRLNNCLNVTALNVAAGSTHEKIRFLLSRENSGGSKRTPVHDRIYYTYDNPEEIEVESAPLDEIIIESVDLVLVDIEGSEVFALRGMQRLLSTASVLAIEFMPFHIKEVANSTVEEFASLIVPHFDEMFVPATGRTVLKHEMADLLTTMADNDEAHDLLYFTAHR